MSVVINGSAGVTTNSGAVYNGISSGTAVASTSGTSIDFTSIPSWVKRITVMFNEVSQNSANQIMIVQIGASSITTSGYRSGLCYAGAGTLTGTNATTGFGVASALAAADTYSGSLVLTLAGSNIWVASTAGGLTDIAYSYSGGGAVTLGGTLDRVRITTVAGTATFDAGSINILYE